MNKKWDFTSDIINLVGMDSRTLLVFAGLFDDHLSCMVSSDGANHQNLQWICSLICDIRSEFFFDKNFLNSSHYRRLVFRRLIRFRHVNTVEKVSFFADWKHRNLPPHVFGGRNVKKREKKVPQTTTTTLLLLLFDFLKLRPMPKNVGNIWEK